MQEPALAESIFYHPAQNEIGNYVCDENTQARVLEVFSRQQNSENSLDEQLAVRSLCFDLRLGG
jgi:hypothetical protein